MEDEIEMIDVTFSFGSGSCKVKETVEVEADMTDEELDEMLGEWLWDRSNAHCKKG